MLKIAHITDTHIAEEHSLSKDIDTRKKFLQVLEEISRNNYDLIIHTGDVCYPEGSRSVYSWVKDHLDSTGIPYYLSPGNHDDVPLMMEAFNKKDQPPRVIKTGAIAAKGESLIFLDSSSGRLNMKQKIWFLREMETQEDQLFLFQHHPPCNCGVKVMDTKYPYKTPEMFQKTLLEADRNVILFCGHYHIERELRLDSPELQVYITPPTLGSLDPEADDYIITDPRPGWREIILDRQQLIETKCYYLG